MDIDTLMVLDFLEVLIYTRFLDMLVIFLIPSHVLNEFKIFLQKKLLKWSALILWISLSSTLL